MTPSREEIGSTTKHHIGAPAGAERMPESIAPMLAADAPEPFDSPDYVFELMWGGLRAMAHLRDGVVRLRARNGRDLTPYFPELLCIPDRLKAHDAIIDGEIVAIDAEGHPAFEMLRPRLQLMYDAVGPDREQIPDLPVQLKLKRVAGQITFQAFDLLWLDGRSLVDRALWQRKNRLHDIITPGAEFAAIDFVDDEGVAFFDAVVQRRLEGIVAKLKTSQYSSGRRSKNWLEIRGLQSGDFVVGGYTFGGARRRGEPFSQLLLGAYADGRFEYIGAVSGGLTDAEAKALIQRLEPLSAAESPFFDTPPIPRLIYWTRPELVCRVRFSEWTREGHLRFPILSALRPDLDAAECIVD
jgi:DNA ligase D-like protein (predicted ligase)